MKFFRIIVISINCRTCATSTNLSKQKKRRKQSTNLKLSIPHHDIRPIDENQESMTNSNLALPPNPFTLQYLSYLSRRAESGWANLNRGSQQTGNINGARPIVPEIGRQLDMNSYSLTSRYNLGIGNSLSHQSDPLYSPIDRHNRSEVNIKFSTKQHFQFYFY